jgi:hypothetical protein
VRIVQERDVVLDLDVVGRDLVVAHAAVAERVDAEHDELSAALAIARGLLDHRHRGCYAAHGAHLLEQLLVDSGTGAYRERGLARDVIDRVAERAHHGAVHDVDREHDRHAEHDPEQGQAGSSRRRTQIAIRDQAK